MSGSLAWLIFQTRMALWRTLGPGEREPLALACLEITLESAIPLAVLGIIFSSVSFVVNCGSPTGVAWFTIANTIFFAIMVCRSIGALSYARIAKQYRPVVVAAGAHIPSHHDSQSVASTAHAFRQPLVKVSIETITLMH
jgi:hypothetical protein